MSKTRTPKVRLRLLRNEPASKLRWYPSRLTTSLTRFLVAAGMWRAWGARLRITDTVVTETPLSLATSLIVTIMVKTPFTCTALLIPKMGRAHTSAYKKCQQSDRLLATGRDYYIAFAYGNSNQFLLSKGPGAMQGLGSARVCHQEQTPTAFPSGLRGRGKVSNEIGSRPSTFP